MRDLGDDGRLEDPSIDSDWAGIVFASTRAEQTRRLSHDGLAALRDPTGTTRRRHGQDDSARSSNVIESFVDIASNTSHVRLPMTYLFETQEHAELRASARRFARTQIAPNARAWDEAGEIPRELYPAAAAAGLLGLAFASENGGAGGDVTHALVAADETILAGESVGTWASLSTSWIALPPLAAFGTPAQKDRFMPAVLGGAKIIALAVSEPSAGSDVANLRARAKREGDCYVLDGQKAFVTSGARADLFTVAVRTGAEGQNGISVIVVERETAGLTVSPKHKKTGWWASDTVDLFFDGCRVPAANLVAEAPAGFAALMVNFATERLLIAGQCVAIAELAHREAVAYARSRIAFGKPLVGHQVIGHKLADMATRIAAARALVGESAVRALRGDLSPSLAAMTKNAATDACLAVVQEAVQIHGGNGYMREFLVERLSRDARVYPIAGGTREIMNEIIVLTEGY